MEQQILVCVGDKLAVLPEYEGGDGTHTKDGVIYAAISGYQQIEKAEEKMTAILRVVSKKSIPLVPKPGDIVTAKITRVSQTSATASIHCIGSKPLDQDFRGIIRIQDVRLTELDKVVISECFRPGDLIRAEVVSLGDARSYYLSTARNELGVVYAKSLAGVPMVPVSWQEMQCPESLVIERRKVASAAKA